MEHHFEAGNHLSILRREVERLKIDRKPDVSAGDKARLVQALFKIDEDLATHIESLSPVEIEDLIVNTVYG